MNIQIFGSNKCFDTKKAERYFKERKIKFQYIDLLKYGMSKGEFESVKSAVGLNEMINTKSKDYEKLNLHLIRGSAIREEIALNNPKVLNTPIVRNGKQATVGFKPEIWNIWE
ncbi:MAG TPA: arsenate reductase family protein [Gudongella oleilytica]|jgi:arsenate reductase-like glutaredoxin family protein|nr:arsenate reductase family protein [Gudongella oleilytica]